MERNHAEAFTLIGERDLPGFETLQPIPVLVSVFRIHDEQKVVLCEPVEIGVVYRTAGLVGDEGVLRQTRIERLSVVGQGVHKKSFGTGAADPEAAHVRDVEQSSGPAGREMLLHDPGGVLDRHVPSAELDHPGAGFHVPVMQDGVPKLDYLCLGHAIHSSSSHHTGVWSDAFSLPRGRRSTSAASRRSAACGVSNR